MAVDIYAYDFAVKERFRGAIGSTQSEIAGISLRMLVCNGNDAIHRGRLPDPKTVLKVWPEVVEDKSSPIGRLLSGASYGDVALMQHEVRFLHGVKRLIAEAGLSAHS